MEEIFDKAITFNNTGALHMERKDFKAALKALTIAFHCFQKSYYHFKRSNPDKGLLRGLTSEFNIDEFMQKMHHSEEDGVFIYRHPIRIPEIVEVSIGSWGLLSTVITFNLALANQGLGLETKSMETLRAAARLYKYGVNLEQIRQCVSASPFFLMSILNNLGYVTRTLDDLDQSKRCFRLLLSALLYVTQTRDVNPTDFEVFFANTLVYGLPDGYYPCSAAA